LLTGEEHLTSIDPEKRDLPVYFNNGIINNPLKEKLHVFDTMGRLVASSSEDVDITRLVSGVYMIHLTTVNKIIKIIR